MLDCKFYIERQKQTNILFTNTNNIVSHSCYSYSFMDFFFFFKAEIPLENFFFFK